jgi:hypothetical protein
MPIMKTIMPNGKSGYKFGLHGHTYPTRAGAIKQMKAIYASGYKGKSNTHTGPKHGHK